MSFTRKYMRENNQKIGFLDKRDRRLQLEELVEVVILYYGYK